MLKKSNISAAKWKKYGIIRDRIIIGSAIFFIALPLIKTISDFNRYIMSALIFITGLKLISEYLLKLPTNMGAYRDEGPTSKNTGSRILGFLFGLFLLSMGFYWVFIKL